MAVATYISVPVRAHLRNLSRLPKPELLALEQSIAELGAIGRNLNQLTRLAHLAHLGPSRGDLVATLKACQALRGYTKGPLHERALAVSAGRWARPPAAVEQAFEGMPVVASRRARLGRSTVLHRLHETFLPSFPALMQFALAAEAFVADLFRGWYRGSPRYSSAPVSNLRKRTYIRHD
jgi:hypothetical protein